MSDRSLGQGDGGVRIRRRGFIGAGLAGAGAALVARPSAAVARSAPQTRAPQSASSNGKAAASDIFFLPTRSLYPNLPGIPVDLVGMVETLVRLAIRQAQVTQAKQSLTNEYAIQGLTDVGYGFLFGDEQTAAKSKPRDDIKTLLDQDAQQVVNDYLEKPLRTGQVHKEPPELGAPKPLSLDAPDQFSISWATSQTCTSRASAICRLGRRP